MARILVNTNRSEVDKLGAGEGTMRRDMVGASNLGMASGALKLCYMTAQRTETIRYLRMVTGGQAAVGATLARMCAYEENPANGDLTLVGATASDTTLFAATNTAYERAVQTPFVKEAGRRYAVGALLVGQTTNPNVSGQSGGSGMSSEFALPPRLTGTRTGQTDIPATILGTEVQTLAQQVYAVMAP